jgi:hypothetical protein
MHYRWITTFTIALVLASPSAQAQDTIPDSVARGARSRFRAMPSGKAPKLAELAQDIDLIVRGKVGKATSRLSVDMREIYTDYEILGASVLYRTNGTSVARPGLAVPMLVTLRGGVVNIGGVEFAQVEEALPGLQPGIECLFLLREIDGHYQPVGMSLGALGVVAGKLRSLSLLGDIAPEYSDVPAADAAVDIVARVRLARNTERSR